MNRKKVVGGALMGLAVVLTAGTLVASNMAFKLNYPLWQPTIGVAKTGNNTLALPDNRMTGVNTAKQLMDSIGFDSVEQVQRFVASSDTYLVYTGRAPNSSANDFALAAGESYFVKMNTDAGYLVTGTDDPALGYTLSQPGGVSKTGNNFYAWNYHQTGITAKQLMDDIGFARVQQVQRYVAATDTFLVYTGRAPNPSANNFALVPGEGYFIKMKTTTVYTPSIY